MTIQGLINKLEKAKKAMGPRAKVTVSLIELRDAAKSNDDLAYWELNCFDEHYVPWRGDDDSTYLKSGKERMRNIVVLS